MAINFNGSTQYLSAGAPNLSTFPIWISALFRATALIENQAIVALDDPTSTQNLIDMFVRSTDQVRVRSKGTASRVATTTVKAVVDVWDHGGLIIGGATSRDAIISGGNRVNATDDHSTFDWSAVDTTSIGSNFKNSVRALLFAGAICEVAIGTGVPTDDQWAGLGAGFSPLLVRPGTSIRHYWRLLDKDDLIDLIGGLNMTATGSPTTADHPAVIYPSIPIIGIPAAAGGSTTPQAIAVTAVGVASLSTVIILAQAIPATAVGVASISKLVKKNIAATAIGVAAIKKLVKKPIAVTAVGVASVATALNFKKTIAATAVGVAVLATALRFGQTIAATAAGVASLGTSFIAGVGAMPGILKRVLRRVLRGVLRPVRREDDP